VAIAAVVLLFLLFVKVNRPGVHAPAAFPEKQKTAEEVKPKPAPKRPTLELEIPRSMPVTIDTYIVVEGDTLWSISQRFTGNPYNYPKIAGENRIADPDLIFPGQRIKLIRK
jgi:nucleoid-associated protein YgaU